MLVEQWLGVNNTLGIDIWNRKYKQPNENFDQWVDRISNGYDEIKRLIKEKKFLFAGRILTNYNTNNGSDVSNCFSEGYVPDSLDGIMDMAKTIALTYKAQGGEGISLSKIRPKGSKTKSGFVTDGIIPFMEIFNTVTKSVSQGNSRRGALMMSIDVWHKEAPEFIKIKTQQGKIEGANLSVEIDDRFMHYVREYLETGERKTVDRTFKHESGVEKYTVCPADVWDLICECAKDWGEPGVIFTNKFRNYNLMELIEEYQIVTSNPCKPLLHGLSEMA